MRTIVLSLALGACAPAPLGASESTPDGSVGLDEDFDARRVNARQEPAEAQDAHNSTGTTDAARGFDARTTIDAARDAGQDAGVEGFVDPPDPLGPDAAPEPPPSAPPAPVDPLEPYAAPDCDGFVAYWVPAGQCMVVRGRFEIRMPGSCDMLNPTVSTCSTFTASESHFPEGVVRYLRAEDGRAFAVARHENADDCVRACE